jgi:gamma-glutamylcyclotransferase (GGCT)/AIG2-like uncharacterized protein YtfP
MPAPLLAAYGTLRRTFGRQASLGVDDQLSFVTSCWWTGRLYDLGSYPGAVPGEGTVQGELFRLRDPRAWTVLDRYEGYDPDREAASLFVRRPVPMDEPADEAAWVYWYNGPVGDHERVPSGDWATYVEEEA